MRIKKADSPAESLSLHRKAPRGAYFFVWTFPSAIPARPCGAWSRSRCRPVPTTPAPASRPGCGSRCISSLPPIFKQSSRLSWQPADFSSTPPTIPAEAKFFQPFTDILSRSQIFAEKYRLFRQTVDSSSRRATFPAKNAFLTVPKTFRTVPREISSLNHGADRFRGYGKSGDGVFFLRRAGGA